MGAYPPREQVKSSGTEKLHFSYEQTSPLDVPLYYFRFGLSIPKLFTVIVSPATEKLHLCIK